MDLEKATQSAILYVESYGLSDEEVYVSSRGSNDEMCLDRDYERENKIKKIISKALNNALTIIRDNKTATINVSMEILKKEFLVSEEIEKILSKFNLKNEESFDYKNKLIELFENN